MSRRRVVGNKRHPRESASPLSGRVHAGGTAGGQLSLWACPRCGTLYNVELVGQVRTRHHGNRDVALFYRAGGEDRPVPLELCDGCGERLHWLYNGQRANGRPIGGALDDAQ